MKLDSIDVVSGDYGVTLPLNFPQAELPAIWAWKILESGVLEAPWGESMWRHLVVGLERPALPMTQVERLIRRENEIQELADTFNRTTQAIDRFSDALKKTSDAVREIDRFAERFARSELEDAD